jgi:uncharacterized protein
MIDSATGSDGRQTGKAMGERTGNDRTCIVTGKAGEPDDMIRFVAGPDGAVVPDIGQKLPGRGCWVTGERGHVEQAIKTGKFARGLKESVKADLGLADQLDELLVQDALRSFAMARKAGQMTSGATQVDKAVRSGAALAVLASLEAAEDGVRKIDQARRATVHLGGPDISSFRLFSVEQMDLAFGDGNVIHAAILDGGAGYSALRRTMRLDRYRNGDRQQPEQSGEGKRTKYER